MNNGTGRDGLKSAIADYAREKTGQELPDSELEASANALLSYFQTLAETDQKLMKEARERDNRNPNHPDQA